MSLLKSIFIWWQDQTIGTWWFTLRHGDLVGEDDQGNKYYQKDDGERRWVVYNGDIEASRVPPEWHRWLHYTVDQPPTELPPLVKPWEKEHVPNLTGTAGAYFPPGSLNSGGQRSRATGDYEAWQPE
jgi:NADH:ubiquinone oxidoreductase subunit